MKNYLKEINKFKVENGIDAPDEKILAIVHLMNTFSLDKAQAIAQTALQGDYGMDAWHFVEETRRLTIYRSRLSEYATQALQGITGFKKIFDWLGDVILSDDQASMPADNPCLYNLHKLIRSEKKAIKKVHFELISPFRKEEVENLPLVDEFEEYVKRSRLNKKNNLQLSVGFERYNLEAVVSKVKEYLLERSDISQISLNHDTQLEIAFIQLSSLVELYRQRGDLLFDKNVRLSLKNYKRAKDRLVTPMESTLEKICASQIPAEIFTFYHGGVTIAVDNINGKGKTTKLEAPSVINGCQTITIANQFQTKLEHAQDQDKLANFHKIKVIAKIVVAADENDLREITNANNRHNAIDNWQLYSNTAVHIAIELALRSRGIFYERQEGKFDALYQRKSLQEEFPNTNKTYISVQQLGQLIALCKRHLNWAAKKSEIFTRTENHDKIFDSSIVLRCPEARCSRVLNV